MLQIPSVFKKLGNEIVTFATFKNWLLPRFSHQPESGRGGPGKARGAAGTEEGREGGGRGREGHSSETLASSELVGRIEALSSLSQYLD